MLFCAVLLIVGVTAKFNEEEDSQPLSLWSMLNWRIGRLLDYDQLHRMNQRFNDIVLLATDYDGFKAAQNQKLNDKLNQMREVGGKAMKPTSLATSRSNTTFISECGDKSVITSKDAAHTELIPARRNFEILEDTETK